MKVLLENGVWLTDGVGDPPRTEVEKNAKDFNDVAAAMKALAEARKYRPFENAEFVEDFI